MATLYLVGGVRRQSLSFSEVVSGGSRAEYFAVNFYRTVLIGPEIGIGYERRFTKNYCIGGRFLIGPNTAFFAASITAGAYF